MPMIRSSQEVYNYLKKQSGETGEPMSILLDRWMVNAKNPKEIIKEVIKEVKIKKFDIGHCSVCKGLLSFDLNDPKDVELLEKSIDKQGFGHRLCIETSKKKK